MPPLVVEESHLDRFVAALDDVLTRELTRNLGRFVAGNLADRLRRVP